MTAALAWLKRDAGDGARRFTWIHLAGCVPPFDRGSRAPDVMSLLDVKDFGPTLTEAENRAVIDGTLALDLETRAKADNTYAREVARTTLALARCLQDAFDYTQPDSDVSETWSRTAFIFTAPGGLRPVEIESAGTLDSVHEQRLHVPLVIRHPDSLTGERVAGAVVELQDVLPTCVEWFDLATPRHVSGRSLLALLDTYVERPFERRPAVTLVDEHLVSVRDERYHLVWDARDPQGSARLFEPARDPNEREDLSAHLPASLRALASAAARALPSPP